ncbi:peptide methionine sulfoxide reductase MsrA [Auriculariales sp. MPI-PUGE-AT-0066]|nr:peptide methionine sulfoxide reductase MsrA [Auriculariales sp. MPI-PUGE-AT-0066]
MAQIITRIIASMGPQSPVRDVQPTLPRPQEDGDEVAIFAMGNFYSAEMLFLQNFSHRGLRTSSVGYVGGSRSAPSYRSVMLGGTGHALAVRLEYDPNQISYAALVEFFYRAHEPTKRNVQGPDKGSQFRSAIFCLSKEQRDQAVRITGEVQKIRFAKLKKNIVTKIVGPGQEQGGIPDWWDAEDEHQKFLFIHRGEEAEQFKCPSHKMHW